MRALLTSLLLTVAAFALWPADSRAGWGGGGCSTLGAVAPMMMMQTPVYSRPDGWAEYEPDWKVFWRADQPVAGYCPSSETYYDRANGTWVKAVAPWLADGVQSDDAERRKKACGCVADCKCGKRCKCKTKGKQCVKDCPCAPKAVVKSGETDDNGVRNFGVEMDRLKKEFESSTINGQPVTKQRAIEAVSAPTGADVPDDSGKLRLTVIGADADTAPVLKDLASSNELAAVKDKLLVQAYTPDNWAVAGAGFVTTGKPTIYLQAPTGKVLARLDSYPGAPALAEAVRKADPTYDPSKDPNPLKPAAPSLPGPIQDVPTPVWILGAAGVALLILRKKGQGA